MRRNTGNKAMAASLTAFALMMAVSPVTAQAAGLKSIQAKEDVSYIALKNCNQGAIVRRVKLLGVKSDCLGWIEDMLNKNCPVIPEVPCEPETEVPTMPTEPETEAPTIPAEPETETPTVPAEPETEAPSSFAAQVIKLINAERAKEGLKPLAYDAAIEKAALVRAKEIQTSFSHTRPNGTGFITAMQETGVTYRRAGENIAWGQRTPEEVVKVWMNSPSHRANIMNANYGRIGVGHLTNAGGTSYWVQLFAD